MGVRLEPAPEEPRTPRRRKGTALQRYRFKLDQPAALHDVDEVKLVLMNVDFGESGGPNAARAYLIYGVYRGQQRMGLKKIEMTHGLWDWALIHARANPTASLEESFLSLVPLLGSALLGETATGVIELNTEP